MKMAREGSLLLKGPATVYLRTIVVVWVCGPILVTSYDVSENIRNTDFEVQFPNVLTWTTSSKSNITLCRPNNGVSRLQPLQDILV